MPDAAPAVPAATVIVLRPATTDFEVLLLRRSSRSNVHGGAWVFPGGHVDPEDFDTQAPTDGFIAARNAAVRETSEEAGLTITAERLVYFSHWTTPLSRPKRFSTWFFVTDESIEQSVRVDGQEINAHRWLSPRQALQEQRDGTMNLPPPTFVSLSRLRLFRTANDAFNEAEKQDAEVFFPKLFKVDGGHCSIYQGDAGYESARIDEPGMRHRLWMVGQGWKYEQSRHRVG